MIIIVHVCIYWIILSIIKTLCNRSIDMGKNTSTTKENSNTILNFDDTDSSLPSNDLKDMIICHICNLSVPRSHMSKHEKSTRHTLCLKIANISLERITKNLNQKVNAYDKCTLDKSICYCKTCSVVVDKYYFESHTKTKKHLDSLKNDEKLKELVALFINEPECCSETNDKSPLNEPVVVELSVSGEIQTNEKIKEIKTDNPADIQTSYIKTDRKRTRAKKAKVTKPDATTLQSASGTQQTVDSVCPVQYINVPAKLEASTSQSTSIIDQSASSNVHIPHNIVPHNIVTKNEEADSDHLIKTTENELKLTAASKVYDIVKNTNDTEGTSKWKFLNDYIKLINKTKPHPNNLRIIHDNFVELTAENGDKIVIDFEKINTYPLNVSDSVVFCKVCCMLTSGRLNSDHMTSEKHILGLVEPIKDRNCIRKLTGGFSGKSHCLLCDKVLEQSQITAHTNENAHRNNVRRGQVEEEIEEICLRTVEQGSDAVKLVYDPNIINKDEKNAKAFGDERKIHCEVCKENMIEDHAMDHELSREHQLKTKKFNIRGMFHYHLQTLSDPKALYCQVCCTVVPKHRNNADEHVNGAQHQNKYLKMLQNNSIYNFGAGFKCSLCHTIFSKEMVFDHIKSVGHEVKFKTLIIPPKMIMGSGGSCNICNVTVNAKNMAAHVESAEHRLQIQKITDDDYYVCPICHVAFPYSLESIKQHNKTKQHSHNIQIYETENFLTVNNGICVCHACGYHMSEHDIYAHVSTYQHAVHSIAYCMEYCSY